MPVFLLAIGIIGSLANAIPISNSSYSSSNSSSIRARDFYSARAAMLAAEDAMYLGADLVLDATVSTTVYR